MDVLEAKRPTTQAKNLTAAFWRWFGNSKVVDENGRPLVVYHGTRVDFNSFDKKKHGSNYGHDPVLMQGFYFSSEEWIADSIADNSDEPGVSRTIAAYLSLQDPVVIDMARRAGSVIEIGRALAMAKQLGHDGAIIQNWNDGTAPMEDYDGNPEQLPSQYVAFQPYQIKSATSNLGGFDPCDPDITH